MKRYTFKSIRSRLTYWFLILSLIPLMFTLVITYFQRVDVIESRTFDKLVAIRDLKVQRLKYWFDERVSDMKVMAGDFEIRRLESFFLKGSTSPEDNVAIDIARELLNRNLLNYSDYSEIFVVSAKTGLIELSTSDEYVGKNKSNDTYFSGPMETGEIFIKGIYYSKSTDHIEMTFSLPIYSLENNSDILGVLVARIDLSKSLYKILLDRVGLGETGETLIVNEDVMALNELRHHDNAPLNLKIKAEPAVMASQGNTGITITQDYRGVDILAAYAYIPEAGWGFVCKQDLTELNEPIRMMLWNFIALFFIIAILIFFISLYIGKSISKPIVEMVNVSKDLEKGIYSVRNKIGSGDEIGILGLTINSMAETIETKMKIQESTAEISETIVHQASMQTFGSELMKRMMEVTGATMSAFYILNEATSEFDPFSSIGANEEMLKPFHSDHPEGEIGNVISSKAIYHLKDIPEDTIFKYKTSAGEAIPKEIISIPLLSENIVVAIISLVSIHKFSNDCIQILNSSLLGITASYSNLMSSERTRILAEQLSRTNEALEAQTEELQDQTEEMQDQADELHRTSEELQEQNIELETQRQQVDAASKLKSEFLSNMSHELRTPLNSIMALSRVLIMQAKDKLTTDENKYLEIVERNGKRLLALINDILDLSKIEAGKMEVDLRFISLSVLLKNIGDSLLPIVQEKGLKFNLNIDEDLPKIETDESKLHQVLQNVISNAVKFTEEGSVSINVNRISENVIIEIVDTGIGIPEKSLPHIFEEFRQVDGSTSRQFEGTGLGLTIASKMLKILGGEVEVSSKLNEGSTFTITLPVNWSQELQQPVESIPKPIFSKTGGQTMLIVDDDPEFIKTISGFLSYAGYKTIGATSGPEAIALAEKHQPFAITLDILMPGMDGWEVLEKLKEKEKTKDIPVIMISVTDDRETGIALGAVGYINKPIVKSLLLSEIYKLKKVPTTIMIVDDNEFDRNQMAEIIEKEKIGTIVATGGKECIELLRDQIPDILVLDLMMPDVDGFEVLERIRERPETKELPVIIVTAKDLTQEDKDRFAGKISSILAKSDSTPQDLFKEIQRILTELENSQHETVGINSATEKRILIVEDNEEAIIQVKNVLENDGYIVDLANNGKEALDYVKHTIPHGIILDLMMPEIDGFEVLEEIRSTERTKRIPVLVLTAKDLTRKDKARLSTNNIQQLIIKGDVDIEGLLFKVKLMLGDEPVSIKKSKKKGTKTHKGLPRVLVVEDNPDNMTTIKAILKGKFKISEAMDGKEGLKMAQSQLHDLILLDMSLPKMGGEAIIKVLKRSDKTDLIPTIAVTAQAMKGDKEKFLKAGCDGYVSKPIDHEKLLEEIGRVLNDN